MSASTSAATTTAAGRHPLEDDDGNFATSSDSEDDSDSDGGTPVDVVADAAAFAARSAGSDEQKTAGDDGDGDCDSDDDDADSRAEDLLTDFATVDLTGDNDAATAATAASAATDASATTGCDVGDATPAQRQRDLDSVVAGGVYLKYGKRGKPHQRFVCVDLDRKAIGYREQEELRVKRKGVGGRATGIGANTIKWIKVSDILQVKQGQNTKVWNQMRDKSSTKNVDAGLCLSLCTFDRTLDLQATTTLQRDQFCRGVKHAIAECNGGTPYKAVTMPGVGW